MKMHIYLPALLMIATMLLPSCATIMSKKTTEVSVYTSEPYLLTHNGKTYHSQLSKAPVKGNVVKFNPERSKDSLRFIIHNEQDSVRYAFNSKTNYTMLLNVMNYGLGLIADLNSKKRYTYPRHINLTNDTLPAYRGIYVETPKLPESPIMRKGMWTLNIAIPFFNSLSTVTDNYKKSRSGRGKSFFGLELGSDYYYHQNRYFNLNVGITSKFGRLYQCGSYFDMGHIDEFPHTHEHIDIQSVYASLTHNHRVGTFSLGYGIAYGTNWWRWREITLYDKISELRKTMFETRHTLGMMFHAHYMPSESFFAGVDYRPTFLRFQKHNKFEYEHLISITLGWKIKLKDGR